MIMDDGDQNITEAEFVNAWVVQILFKKRRQDEYFMIEECVVQESLTGSTVSIRIKGNENDIFTNAFKYHLKIIIARCCASS